MKIGINCLPLIPGKIGGMENYFRNLLEGLVCLKNSDQYTLLVNDQNEHTFSEGEKIKKTMIRDDNRYSRMMKIVENSGFDLYFCPFLTLDPSYVSVPTAVTVPDIQQEFHPELFSRDVLAWRKEYIPLTIKNADLILTLSEYSKRTIIEKYNASRDKVHGLHLDVGEEHKKSYDAAEVEKARKKYNLPEKFIFYPANTWPHKNHEILLKALNALKKNKSQPTRLLLTGAEDSAHPNILRMIQELNLSDSVRFLGYVDRNELPLIYRAAELLVFPSLFEGFGIPLLEAMRAKIPIIAADDTSIPEVAGNAAVLFEPKNFQQLAEKIDLVLNDSSLKEKLIREGMEQSKKFDWNRTADQTQKLFEKTVEDHKKKKSFSRVSVLIHSFKRDELLQQSVDSVLAQEYPEIKIAVIDGSASEKYFNFKNDQIALYHDRNNARYDSVHKHLKSADGDIVGWMNAGDTLDKGSILNAVKMLEKNSDLSAVYGDGITVSDDLSVGVRPVNVVDYRYLAEAVFRYQIPVFVRKKIFLDSPVMNNGNYKNRDYSYWLGISSKIPIAYHPSVKLNSHTAGLIFRRNNGDQLSLDEDRMVKKFMSRIKTYYGHFPLSWVPGMVHYRCKGKPHLYLLSNFGLFSGEMDYDPDSFAGFLKLYLNRIIIFMFGWYLRLRRLPYVIYRIFFRPQIGSLGNEKNARPIKIVQKKPAEKIKDVPKISIVTPSYNQADFIERTMKSVLDQEYPNLEYVVMDGGSKDRTPEILKQYGEKLTFWSSQKDKGQTNALNLGFAHATGEIMAYLNSDDLLMPGALEYVARYFVENPDVDVIYGHRILVNAEGNDIGRWILPEHDSNIIQVVDYVPQETLFWRRSIWEKVGGTFDESFHYAMDWDLIVRFIQSGAKIVRVPAFLGAFRVHDKQKTTATLDVGEDEVGRIRKRVLGYVPEGKQINRIIGKYLLKARALEVSWKLGFVHFDIE